MTLADHCLSAERGGVYCVRAKWGWMLVEQKVNVLIVARASIDGCTKAVGPSGVSKQQACPEPDGTSKMASKM